MPAVSFSQLDFIVNKARITPSPENKGTALAALLQFAVAENPRQRIKASTVLPEFHEICTQRQSDIHEAIFDLCEDPLEHVRIAGYHSIVDLSRRASSVRRKNADVLCQLLQSEGASELAVVRGCLSQHIRIASEITYNIIAEYLVTNSGSKPARGPLMGVILSFLDGGGLGPSWTNSTYAISSNEAMAAFSERDVEGGKGAILEVSWLQKNAAADAILRKSLHSALLCATLAEARTIISSILYSLSSECTPLGNDSTELLNIMIHIASMQSKKELTKTPITLTKALSCLDLGASTLSPVASPIPSAQPNAVFPRADPTPMLKLCLEWIVPTQWSKYSIDAQISLTTILGAALRASNAVLGSRRKLANGQGAHLAPCITTLRNEIIDAADQVIQSWINSSAYNGNDGTCQAISQLLLSISERKVDSRWTPGFEKSARIQTMRKIALKYTGVNASFHFLDLLLRIDIALAQPLPQEDSSSAKSNAAVPASATMPDPAMPKPPVPNDSNDALSRKRLRKELEDRSSQNSQLGEDRNFKRQKVVPPNTFSLIQKHRTSAISAINPSSSSSGLVRRIEAAPDVQMADALKDGEALCLDRPRLRFNPKNAILMMSHPTGVSIRGAASTSVPEKDTRAQTQQERHAEEPGLGNPPRAPALNRDPSVTAVMNSLKIHPTPPDSQTSSKPNAAPQSPAIRQSPHELQDSVKRLLLGKPSNGPIVQERKNPPPPPPRSIPGNSLLDRIAGSKGSLPSLQPQPPAINILDRVGIPSKIRGGNGGTRSDGRKKRGM